MRKPLALIWLLLTLLPIVYMGYFINYVLGLADRAVAQDVQQFEAQFFLLFKVHMAFILLIWGLITSYIVYVFRTDHVAKDKKALWAVVLFMAGIFAMPIFWFLYVWKPLRTRDLGTLE